MCPWVEHNDKWKSKWNKINYYLNTSSLFLGNGTTVGTNGALLNGLSLTFMTFVAWASDNTKNECQCVCKNNNNKLICIQIQKDTKRDKRRKISSREKRAKCVMRMHDGKGEVIVFMKWIKCTQNPSDLWLCKLYIYVMLLFGPTDTNFVRET